MKKTLLLIVALIVSTATINAQRNGSDQDGKEKNKDMMTQFFNAKVKMLKEKLVMDDAQTEKFIPVYKAYLDEMHETFKKNKPQKKSEDVKTNEDACKVLTEGIDGRIQVLNVQKKYLPKFSEVLNTAQLMKLMRVENDMQRQVRKEFDRRGPGKQAKDDNPGRAPKDCPAGNQD